ncbi:HAMP domain-containing protein [Flexistipes sp.]|uniref:HAMP domain-containing protein n=1 Tax=Flexistipes sp. TaxID=3088135 RepID=UPI002E1C731C|nr:cache domain-containing protein [Flexistipes sp.]
MAESQVSKMNEIEKSKFFSVKAKILLIFLISFGIIIAIWVRTYSYFSKNMIQNTEKILTDTSKDLSNYLQTWINFNFRQLNLLASMEEFKNMNPAQQKKILEKIPEKYPWVYLAFSTDIRGNNIARSDNNPLKDYSDRKYVKGIREGEPRSWQRLIGKTSGKPALVLSVPIKRDSRRVGVLAVAMTLKEISQYVTNWSRGKTGYAFLLDNKNYILAHKNPAFTRKMQQLPYKLKSKDEGNLSGFYHFTDKTGTQYVAKVEKTVFDWKLVVAQSSKEAYAQIIKVRNLMLIAVIVIILVVLPTIYLFTRALGNQIIKLSEIADSLSGGDLDVENNIKTNDEIGLLANSMRRLQRSLKLAKDMLEK